MATLIAVVAGLLVLIASVLAVAAPRVLVENHQRWSKVSIYVALAGIAWMAMGAVRAVNVILRILHAKGTGSESALDSVQALASTVVNQQHVYGPALVALIVAGVYLEIVGRNRARALSGNAA